MWTSLTSWLTLMVLFCVLNLIIGTVVIVSTFRRHPGGEHDSPPLQRVPLFLERVRSANFSLYMFEQDTRCADTPDVRGQFARAPSFLERLRSMKFHPYQSEQPDPYPPVIQNTDSNELSARTETPGLRSPEIQTEQLESLSQETEGADATDGQTPKVEAGTAAPTEEWEHHVTGSKSDRRGKMMKRWASEKKAAEGEEEDVYRRRPATARERKGTFGVAEEVDAKADEFINWFKQQLKLQRIVSLMRIQRQVDSIYEMKKLDYMLKKKKKKEKLFVRTGLEYYRTIMQPILGLNYRSFPTSLILLLEP